MKCARTMGWLVIPVWFFASSLAGCGGEHRCESVGETSPDGRRGTASEDCDEPGDDDHDDGAEGPGATWAKIFGDGVRQTVVDVAFDTTGNIFVVGKFDGSLSLGDAPLESSGNDIYVVKLDPMGNTLWARSYGDDHDQTPRGVAVDGGGNVIVVGDFEGSMDVGGKSMTAPTSAPDLFVFKLDPRGTRVWAKQLGDAEAAQSASSVAVGPDDDVVVAGTFAGSIDLDGEVITASGQDVFLMTLSPEGETKWVRSFGDAGDPLAHRVRVDERGDISLTGAFFGALTFEPCAPISANGSNAYLARLDAEGRCSWAKRFDSAVTANPHGLAVGDSGDVVVAIETNGDIDVGGGPIALTTYDSVVVKYDVGGAWQWQTVLGGPGDDHMPRLALDSEGRVLVSFHTDGVVDGGGDLPSGGGMDIVVAGLEPSGAPRWTKRYGLGGDQTHPVVAAGPGGRVLVAGNVNGPLDFGTGEVLSPKKNDIAVAVLDAD